MRFEVRHPMPRSADIAWRAFFSPDYEAALRARDDSEVELLEEGDRGGIHYRRTKVTSGKTLPGFMQRALQSDRLSYVLEQWRDDRRMELRWKVTPPAMPDKIRAAGNYSCIATPSGCERIVNGEISVAIPLVGGKIETAIGDELRASYERTAVFARQWLLDHTPELA